MYSLVLKEEQVRKKAPKVADISLPSASDAADTADIYLP